MRNKGVLKSIWYLLQYRFRKGMTALIGKLGERKLSILYRLIMEVAPIDRFVDMGTMVTITHDMGYITHKEKMLVLSDIREFLTNEETGYVYLSTSHKIYSMGVARVDNNMIKREWMEHIDHLRMTGR